MDTYTESQRGIEVKALLQNPLFREAFDTLRAGIVDKWRSCPVRDKEGQHELKLMDVILSNVENYIKQIADTGKMADIQLERERKVAKLKEAGIR